MSKELKRIVCPCCMREMAVDELHFRAEPQRDEMTDSGWIKKNDPYIYEYRKAFDYKDCSVETDSYYAPFLGDSPAGSWGSSMDTESWVMVKGEDKEVRWKNVTHRRRKSGRYKPGTVLADHERKMIVLKLGGEKIDREVPICPHCHQILAFRSGFEEPIRVLLAGITQNAKTAFLWSLANTLSRVAKVFTFNVRGKKVIATFKCEKPECNNSFYIWNIEGGAEKREAKMLPATDAEKSTPPLVIHMKLNVDGKEKRYIVVFSDIAGEVGNKITDKAQRSISIATESADAVFMMIKSDGYLGMNNKEVPAIADLEYRAGLYVNRMHKGQRMAYIISKSDLVSDWLDSIDDSNTAKMAMFDRENGMYENTLRYIYEADSFGEYPEKDPCSHIYFNRMNKTATTLIEALSAPGNEPMNVQLEIPAERHINNIWFFMSALGCETTDEQFSEKQPRHLFDPLMWLISGIIDEEEE